MKPLDILINARELIRLERNWTQGSYSRDSAGNSVFSRGLATSFCAVGACLHTKEAIESVRGAVDILEAALKVPSLHNFNDTHTHAEVLQLFDTTIERLRNGIRKNR